MRRRGTGLPELLLTLGLFSLLGLLSYLFLSQSVGLWKGVSGTDSASLSLKRAQRFLERDLLMAETDGIRLARVPASLPGGGDDGQAVWFLSSLDPATGEGARRSDGSPFWQRSILYYLVVPAGHTACVGGKGPRGMDDRCPHKVLIRKQIDFPPVTGPGTDPEATEEGLLDDVAPYLTRPTRSLDVSAMRAEPGVEQVEAVAANLLWLEVSQGPDPRWPGEVQVDLRSVSEPLARQKVRLGVDPLFVGAYTLQQSFSVFPRN